MSVVCVALTVCLLGGALIATVADGLVYESPHAISRDVPWGALSAVLLSIAALVALGGGALALAIDEVGGFAFGLITAAFAYSLLIGARWCWRKPL